MMFHATGRGERTWPGGVVRVYDGSGMPEPVSIAKERWNRSGARVRFESVRRPSDADLVVRVDDAKLLGLCGRDCLGFSSAIGRPASGRVEVLLLSDLDEPRPLSVWVTAHELGHVLGLRHRNGGDCSVMSPRAFETRCSPSAFTGPGADEDACVPAPRDVDVAAHLYGGAAASRDPRCR